MVAHGGQQQFAGVVDNERPLGDVIGRKRVLVATLVLVGAATFLIGCLPTHAVAGPVAPALLVLLRFAQGVGVGGAVAPVIFTALLGKFGVWLPLAGYILVAAAATVAGVLLGRDPDLDEDAEYSSLVDAATAAPGYRERQRAGRRAEHRTGDRNRLATTAKGDTVTTLRTALCQFTAGTEPRENLRALDRLAEQAASRGAQLAVFPEASMARFGVPLAPLAEPLGGPWADGVRDIAQRHGLTIVAGMFTPASGGRVANTLLATGPDVEARYDKIHLYDAFGFRESDTVAPGRDVTTIDLDGVRVGLATCYDVRFPELFRAHADAGAVLSVLPTAWGAGPGKLAQWELLTRARALDATVWLAATGQAPPDPDADLEERTQAPTGVGHSVLVGPDGRVREQAGVGEELIVAEVDVAEAERVRRAVAVLDNRRL